MSLALVILLGLLVGAVLGGLGAGGSILTVPVLVYVAHLEPAAAATGALVVVGLAALAGTVAHGRAGTVRWRVGMTFGALGVAGAVLGSRLATAIDGRVLMLAFSGLLLVAAALLVHQDRAGARGRGGSRPGEGAAATANAGQPPAPRTSPSADPLPGQDERPAASTALLDRSPPPGPPNRVRTRSTRLPVIVAAAAGVGLLTGFFGVGGGFLVVPALAAVLGLTIPEAVGTGLLVIALNSATALLARAGYTPVDWALVAPFALAAVLGSGLGERIGRRLGGPALTVAFAGLLLAVGSVTAVHTLIALAR